MDKHRKPWVIALLVGGLMLWLSSGSVTAQNLRLSREAAAVGEEVVVGVTVATAPNAVEVLGFDVLFDAAVLTYQGFTRGPLVTNWTAFDVSQPATGRLRIGGFTAEAVGITLPEGLQEGPLTPIPEGASDVLASLRFVVAQATDIALSIAAESVVDDITPATWELGDGELLTGMRGDCDGGEAVSAFDVSAFIQEFFDGDGLDPLDTAGGTFAGNAVGCDADASGLLSAGDIACIINIFFRLPCQ